MAPKPKLINNPSLLRVFSDWSVVSVVRRMSKHSFHQVMSMGWRAGPAGRALALHMPRFHPWHPVVPSRHHQN